MSETKCNLTNNLIEGFLYEILDNWLDFDTIEKMLLKHFGENICVPSDLTKHGEKRYIVKLKKTLKRGIMNKIYLFDEATQRYKNNV
ncbi:MAG: hypothetical protein K9W44_09940 [Candidatus Lokiarchaeota archaeon]|nr:hypothetical protein [Candidatus Harpocratesius repetitus]